MLCERRCLWNTLHEQQPLLCSLPVMQLVWILRTGTSGLWASVLIESRLCRHLPCLRSQHPQVCFIIQQLRADVLCQFTVLERNMPVLQRQPCMLPKRGRVRHKVSQCAGLRRGVPRVQHLFFLRAGSEPRLWERVRVELRLLKVRRMPLLLLGFQHLRGRGQLLPNALRQ